MLGNRSGASARQIGANVDEEARSALIASRLRQGAGSPLDRERRVPSFALGHAVSGDIGHLHAAHDLTALPVVGRERLTKPLILRLRRAMRRGLYPIPEAQSMWNGANARVVSYLLRQLVAQARAIESLEQQVAQMHDELHR